MVLLGLIFSVVHVLLGRSEDLQGRMIMVWGTGGPTAFPVGTGRSPGAAHTLCRTQGRRQLQRAVPVMQGYRGQGQLLAYPGWTLTRVLALRGR